MSSRAPIIFIGTQRSGTTWMGSVFERHPRIAYYSEPRHIWTWGNAYRPDDVLTAADARPKVVRHIRETFEAYVSGRGKDRLAEKTPSNCLRIPFIHAVYPEAKIILVIRDGRSVLRSTEQILKEGVPARRIVSRALGTPLREWPAYAPRAASTIVRKLTRRPLNFWGPRPPGWRDWLRTDSQPVILARQWVGTIERAWSDIHTIPETSRYVFRYEDLMREPRRLMQEIVDFCELADADELVNYVAETADPSRQKKWRDVLDAAVLEEIRPVMEPTLTRLGYSWN